MQDFSTSLQKSTRNSSDKLKFFKQRKLSAVESDCRLYNSDPPEIPKKFENIIADIPNVLQENVSDHYKDKRFDEPLQINPKKMNDRKAVQQKWIFKDIDRCESVWKVFKTSKLDIKETVRRLKIVLPSKSTQEIVEYTYMFHQLHVKKQCKNIISKVPFTTEQTNVQNSSAENEQKTEHSPIDQEADNEHERLGEEVCIEVLEKKGI